MGHRANYILRRGGCTQRFYSDWGAPSLAQDIFWGPDETTRFMRSLPATDELPDEDFWGDAAVVVDWDARRLIWCEGDRLVQGPLGRRLYVRLLEQTWSEWEVRYAADGIRGIRRYLEIAADTRQPVDVEHTAEAEAAEYGADDSGTELAGDLEAGERACLGALVTLLLEEDRLDPQAVRDSIHEATRGVTAGCGCVAGLVTLAAAGVAAWVRTIPVTILCIAVALAVLIPAVRLRRRTARLVAVAEGFQEAPRCAGPSLWKKRSILDQALARLGYPTTDQLEQAGQLSVPCEAEQADDALPDRFGPLRAVRADEIAGVDFYQLRLDKLRFRELRRGTTFWQACLIKCFTPFGFSAGPTIPVPRAQRLILLAWEDVPAHVRRQLDPWIEQAFDSGFAPGLYYTLPMLGRQEAFGIVLLGAEGCVLALFLYARIRIRVTDDEGDTYTDEQLAEASLLSVLPDDALLVTETRRSEFDPLPRHDVQSLEDADWPALLAAHQRRLDLHDRSTLRRFTTADLPAFVLHLNQQEIDSRAAQGVYQQMTREDIDRFAEEG